jgi:hypothetical protein
MTDSIARLRTAGVSVWLDDLSRERLTTGSLAAFRDRGVSGVTTNPTIFARAITDSNAYDAQLRDLKLRRAPVDQVLRELTAFDVRQACDVLRTPPGWTSGQKTSPRPPSCGPGTTTTRPSSANSGTAISPNWNSPGRGRRSAGPAP